MIEIGKTVPKLKGMTAEGGMLTLVGLRGRWVIVYFYPKDNTPGCTREAQEFRDLYPEFKRRGADIIGVSRDSAKVHDGFAVRHALPFSLIADTDEVWCKAFDVIREKILYGKKYLGIVRSTFLIDPDGKLAAEWRNVRVPSHAETVLGSIPAA